MPAQTLQRLDDLIASRSILEHPFYVAWRCGTLSRDQLATYAAVYYPHVAAFPGYLRQAIAGTAEAEIREELERNLADELGVPRAHDALWLDFAEAVGADRHATAAAEPHPAARAMVDAFDGLARSGTAGAVAALYAYESQQPAVAAEKADGLRRQYGVTDPAGLAYFEVHATADLEHRAGERKSLERCLAAGASEDEVLTAATRALDAYWSLLDGVCEATGVPAVAAA